MGKYQNVEGLEVKDLLILGRLGRGLSGYFYETTWDGKKCVRKDFPLGSAERNSVFEREVKKVCKLDDHPNVVKCFSYTLGRNSCSLVQEYVPDNLQNCVQRRIDQEVIRKRGASTPESSRVLKLDEIKRLLSSRGKEKKNRKSKVADAGAFEAVPEAADIISQIATGMRQLHENGVVHGDLKPRNVLVLNSDRSGGWKVKLADYGLTETKKRIRMVSERTRRAEILTWKAPECLGRKNLNDGSLDDEFLTEFDTDSDEESHVDEFFKSKSAMADVYSFGLTCSYILGGKAMSSDMSLTQLRQQRMQGIKPELPESASLEYLKFMIGACLEPDRMKRPTFSMICMVKDAPPHLRLQRLKDAMEGKNLQLGKRKRNDEGTSLGVDDGASTCSRARHEIFLSHSWGQKDFTEQLYKDLKSFGYCPFFGKELQSLEKPENFPLGISQAMRECHVAILVISEEFFSRSKWPMIELTELVQAQALVTSRITILPLFFGLTVKQVNDEGNQKRWQEIWQGWADKDKRINVESWIEALSQILKLNGMEYNASVGEVSYRENVVAIVSRLIPPRWVSNVQALPRLCEAISKRLDEKVESSSTFGCRTVGLFAMGGSGKSTISRAMCNYKFEEFAGKVCHVEFGDTYVMLRLRVLKELTNRRLPDDLDKLETSLKDAVKHQMVFLVLDNVRETDIEEAKMYLEVGFKEGSKVLVTSRSLDVLKSLNLKDTDCMEMPGLEEEDAINLFLYHAMSDCRKHFSQEEKSSIRRCVEACKFAKRDLGGLEDASSTHQYLPLALKVLGIQLGQISKDPLQWLASLERSKYHKFNHFDECNHPLFRVLRQGYDALKPMNRRIFLDLALFFPQYRSFDRTEEKYNVVEWLKIFYDYTKDDIICSLLALRRNGLLEEFGGKDGSEFRIHDLYLNFAREEVKVGSYERSRILYLEGTDITSFELRERDRTNSWSSVERLGLYKSKLKSLMRAKLHLCPNLEMLQLYECSELEEVDVQCFDYLKSLDILECPGLGTKFVGVEKLGNLVWFRWRDIQQHAPFLRDFSSLTALQVLHLSFKDHALTESDLVLIYQGDPLILSGCINLRELTIEGLNLRHLPDLSNLSNLQRILIHHCRFVTIVRGLRSLENLKILSIRQAFSLEELPGLGDLVALEILDLAGCGRLSKLDGLERLQHLRELIVTHCENLSSLDGLEYLTSLRRLDATGCKNLKEIPDYSHLQKLEKIDLSGSGVPVVTGDSGRLANNHILGLSECVGLIKPVLSWWMSQLSGIRETPDGWIASGFEFPEQSRFQLVRVIGEVAAYYLNKSTWFIPEEAFTSLARSFTDSEDTEVWGLSMLIQSLCNLEDTGMLSLFVAKYAATGKYWEPLADESKKTHITFIDDGPYHKRPRFCYR